MWVLCLWKEKKFPSVTVAIVTMADWRSSFATMALVRVHLQPWSLSWIFSHPLNSSKLRQRKIPFAISHNESQGHSMALQPQFLHVPSCNFYHKNRAQRKTGSFMLLTYRDGIHKTLWSTFSFMEAQWKL